MRARALAFLALAAMPGTAFAACPSDEAVSAFLAEWTAKRPSKAMPVETMADAACARDKVVAGLEKAGAKIVGYKAALTAKAVQARFKTDAPLYGVLTDRMIVADGAKVPAGFGAVPVYEADMLLVVKDEGINAARTPEAALASISAMRPFIELPDLVLAPGEKLEGPQLLAINAGARMGVAGAEVPLSNTPETVAALRDVQITVTDGAGVKLAEGVGSATLGSPLNAVTWLVEDMARSGRKLKAGDLISVGSFSPLTPPKPGQTVNVRYEGLPGTPKVSVTFE